MSRVAWIVLVGIAVSLALLVAASLAALAWQRGNGIGVAVVCGVVVYAVYRAVKPCFAFLYSRVLWRATEDGYETTLQVAGTEKRVRVFASIHDELYGRDMAWVVAIGDEGFLYWGPDTYGEWSLAGAMAAAERYVRYETIWEPRSRVRNLLGWLTLVDAVEMGLFDSALNRYYHAGASNLYERLINEQVRSRKTSSPYA
jgi:hypothetical protein